MEEQLLAVFAVAAFRIDGDMLAVLVEHFQGIVDPARIGVLAVDGNAARMAEQEAEATLLEAVLGGQGMDGILAQGRIEDAAVEVAGVVHHENGGFGQDFVLAGRVEIVHLGAKKQPYQDGQRRVTKIVKIRRNARQETPCLFLRSNVCPTVHPAIFSSEMTKNYRIFVV